MPRFLALYLGSPDAPSQAAWERLSVAERANRTSQAMTVWSQWVEQHRSAIRDMGGPLGKTLLATNAGITATSKALTAYVIVDADSHQQAAEMFAGHPHFSIFPGTGVEILECLPMPQRAQ